jgi:predicted transcriptional regulator
LLIAIDENKSLSQIAEEVDMETTTLKKTLSKLLEQRLIEPVKKNIPCLDRFFLEALRINLSKAIGPMAEILVEDVVAEMDLNISEIPVNQAAELINNLSLEIPDEKNRIDFKKFMLAILNKK